MYCSKCGKENPDNGKFCSACGAPLAGKIVPKTQGTPVRSVNRSAAVQPKKAKKGKKLGIIVGLLVVLLLVIVLAVGAVWWLKTPKVFKGEAEVDLPYRGNMFIESDGEYLTLHREMYNDTYQGVIESVEKADKDTMLYRVRVTDVENVEDEEGVEVEIDELLIKMPKDALKGELEGTWGLALIEKVRINGGDAFYAPQVETVTYTKDGSVRAGRINSVELYWDEEEYAKLKERTDDWKDWTEMRDYDEKEIDGYQWKERKQKKGYYSAGKNEMKVLPDK